jgi:chemotaxis protein histidine kinase CheA
LLRKSAEICFLDVCQYITDVGLATLADALASDAALVPTGEMSDDEEQEGDDPDEMLEMLARDDDDDDDDDEDDEEEEEEEEEKEDDDEEEAEQKEEEEKEEGESDEEDPDACDMDKHEAELMALDKAVIAMLKEKNSKKIAQLQRLDFRIKVAYLLLEFVRRNDRSPRILGLLAPLYRTFCGAERAGDKQLASRLSKVLRRMCNSRCVVPPEEGASDANEVMAVMVCGTRDKIPALVKMSC